MNKNNPLESMLTQMTDLMEAIREHKGPINEISPEFIKEIEELKQRLVALNHTAKEQLAKASLDPKTIRIDVMGSSKLSDKEKRAFERATRVNRDVKMLKTEIEKTIKKRKQNKDLSISKPKKKTITTKAQIQKRRKRFKPIGGDKNWIPL